STCSGCTPARSRAALIANPPSSAAEKPARAPDSLPIGVRAPARITEPAIRDLPQAMERQAALGRRQSTDGLPVQDKREPRGRGGLAPRRGQFRPLGSAMTVYRPA